MLIEDFNRTIDLWIKELEQYSFAQLCTKPSSQSWSLGQVYMHLIENTNYFLEQVKICTSHNDNINEECSPSAKTMFLNNEFPNAVLEGPPENTLTPQPVSKEQLMIAMLTLKHQINNAYMAISANAFKGKTKHPGLHYFNANEWFQFAEMHFRHHLRQKKRIDNFLRAL